jgi:hypothetical protein
MIDQIVIQHLISIASGSPLTSRIAKKPPVKEIGHGDFTDDLFEQWPVIINQYRFGRLRKLQRQMLRSN